MIAFGSTARKIILTALTVAAVSSGGAEEPASDRARALLDRAQRFFAGLSSLTVEIEEEAGSPAWGVVDDAAVRYAVQVRRPQSLRLELVGRPLGYTTVVSDGARRVVYGPDLNLYTEGAAPAELADALRGEVYGQGPFLLRRLLTGEMLDGDPTARWVGREELAGIACEHIEIDERYGTVGIWIRSGEEPFVMQCRYLLTIDGRFRTGLPTKGFETITRFSGWVANPKLADERFRFTPPPGARKTGSLSHRAEKREPGTPQQSPFPPGGGRTRDRGEAPLGRGDRRAPVFKARLLDGGELDLAALRGRKVVVLDFWASWCGPCVASLPVVRDVARDFDDVAFYAVNQEESEATIRRFLARHRLDLAVALDPDSRIGDRYGVDGIPHLVVIDRDGIIRSVHEGFSTDLRRRLRAELTGLTRGLSAPTTATTAAAAWELRKAWSVEGRWTAVAAASAVYAVAADGSVARFSAVGERTATLRATGSAIRTANLAGDAGSELLLFTPWGDRVQAIDAQGRSLWTYAGGAGVADVWAADLDGDGRDEVVVGYQGGPGLHVLDSRGRKLWSEASLGNVWNVCAADLDGDRRPEVLASSQKGHACVFGPDGMRRRDLSTGLFATLVRVARTAGGEIRVVVGGSNGDGVALVGLGPDGRRRFTTVVGDDQARLEAVAAAPGRPWLAVSLRGGGIKVVDVSNGALVAETQVDGRRPDVAWLAAGDDPPLLLVATGRAAGAYRLAPRSSR